jgi:thioredoxin:protein disulfide reductase
VKVDGTDANDAYLKATEKYAIRGMPTVIFIDAKGREVPQRIEGAIEADEMLEKLSAVDGACDAPKLPAAVACASRW